MCGIAGIISNILSLVDVDVLKGMSAAIAHRGMDGQAVWVSDSGNAGFSHRRLTVIDTTPLAAQPMHYLNRYTIVYNGEIYNYIELKKELQGLGYEFRSNSDTEVILAAYAEYNDNCVTLFDGMFAFALWDDVEQILFCARDRFGEKPFYYVLNQGFLFASEIKGLEATGLSLTIDNGMLLQFIGTGNTSDASDKTRTFIKEIKKLAASHWLKYEVRSGRCETKKYWEISGRRQTLSARDAIAKFDELLSVSVKRRLRSDVALGTSLSGGIDSSTIATKIFSFGVSNLKTFTASFPGFEKDESAKAKMVARLLSYENYSVAADGRGLAEDFEKLIYHHDEPVASASVYAQYKVFELAAAYGVTVLLDGQGADEVLGGYDHYRKWWLRSIMPVSTAKLLERRAGRIMNDNDLTSDFIRSAGRPKVVKPVVRQLNDLLYFDTFCLGLEHLLTYADRNSMAHGREVRLPFLFHELVDFSFALPSSLKIRGGNTKWVLRKAMSGKLPTDVVWSGKKTGFEPPQKEWMALPAMRDYIMESKKLLVKDGILKKQAVNHDIVAHNAYDRKAKDWRLLAISAFIHKKRGLNRNSTPFLKSNIL
jgi:asparagine synthase (glutamine-hydrolysing)